MTPTRFPNIRRRAEIPETNAGFSLELTYPNEKRAANGQSKVNSDLSHNISLMSKLGGYIMTLIPQFHFFLQPISTSIVAKQRLFAF